MNRTLSIAALLVAATQTAPVAHAGCSWSLGSYTNGFMPDFDQRRQPGPLFWDGMNFIPIPDGLPGNGANYCSPTSHINVMGYLANHGFPALMPGGSAQSWMSQTNYERVTDALQEMGVFMETDPDAGTTCCGHSGFVEYLDTYAPNKFIVTSISSDAFDAPTIGDLAFCALAGGYVNLMVGWFENTDINQWQKTGGHVVTMVGIEGWCGGDRKVKIRDPGGDSANMMAQSTFANNTYTLQQLPGFFDSDGTSGFDVYFQRTYERMMNYNASDGRIGLINGYRVVVPKYGVTLTPPPMSQLNFLNPIIPTHSTIPPQQSYAVPQFAQITDFEIVPDGFNVLCLGADATGAADPRAVLVNRATGETTELPIGGAPRRAAINRTGDRAFFVDETGVIRAMLPSAAGPQVSTITPADPVDLIGFDDRTDTVIALSIAARRLHFFDEDGAPSGPSLLLPSSVPLGSEVFMVIDDEDGTVWLRSLGSEALYNIGFDRVLGAVLNETATLPGTSAARMDSMWTPYRQGKFVALAGPGGVAMIFRKDFTTGQWSRDATNDFDGLPATGGIKIARSRTNFRPEMDGPNNEEQLPGPSSAPEWDCPGDVDLNGDVAFADITGVLSMWGSTDEHPADVDGSGGVGFSDVTGVLSNWGPCE